MDKEDLLELLRLLKKLHEVPRLYCPLRENAAKLSRQILSNVDAIVRED